MFIVYSLTGFDWGVIFRDSFIDKMGRTIWLKICVLKMSLELYGFVLMDLWIFVES